MVRKLAFLVPILLVAPLDLGARPPIQHDEPVLHVAPGPGETATVKGLKLSARIVSKPGRPLVIAMKAVNPLSTRVEVPVALQVMEEPASPPMARMAPMPRERAVRTLEVALGPGETLEQKITFKKVRRPRVKRSKHGFRTSASLFARVLTIKAKERPAPAAAPVPQRRVAQLDR
jgi:hypothetical protein